MAGGGPGKILKAIVRTLSKMNRRNAILVGYPGTGKSAVIYELARRLYHGDATLPKKFCGPV